MRKTFSEVVLFARTGLNPRTNFKLGQGTNKYITIKNIHNNTLVIDNNTDLVDDEALALIHKRSQIKAGDVLFCSIGRIGDMYIIEEDPVGWDVNESVFVFTLNTDIIRQKYFYYLFKHRNIIEYLTSNSSGSTFKSIKMNQLQKMEFELPSLDEQDIIISCLDSVSDIIESHQHQLRAFDTLIKARFVEILESKANQRKTVNDVCSRIVDCPHSTPRYDGKLKNPAIRTSEIKKGYISWDSMRYVSDEEYEERVTRLRPQKGDIVYAREGTFGNAAILPDGYKFCMGQRVMLLRPNYELCTSEYLLHALLSDDVYKQALEKNNASTVAHINVKDVKSFMISLPLMDSQKSFEKTVVQVEKLKNSVQNAIEKEQVLFASLMQQYFG